MVADHLLVKSETVAKRKISRAAGNAKSLRPARS